MNEIKAFVNTLIPAKLPKVRKAELAAELEAHLYEKADFYMEIGYNQDESALKAIDDFAQDESVRDGIFKEFERLYRERTWWSFVAAGVILVMNVIAGFAGIWITSADFNKYPDPSGALISFLMIFVLLFGIVSARILQFRKTLISIGTACVAVGGFFLWCFFPQSAFYTVCIDVWYLIDRFTPFAVDSEVAEFSFFYMAFSFLLICALYCFVEAYRIRWGKARTSDKAWKKAAVFAAVYFAVTALSCSILTTARQYEQNRPVWFNLYYLHVCEESNTLFDAVNVSESYATASATLRSYGMVPIDEYENSLDKLSKKIFRDERKDYDFRHGYEIWFNPERNQSGNGFFAIKCNESGVVTSIGIGNVFEEMYYFERYGRYFMYSDSNRNDDMDALETAFRLLVEGADEAEVMGFFGTDEHRELGDMHGETYTKFVSVENGETVTYYRVYAYGLTDPYAKDYERYSSVYFEFTFTDGGLSKAKMHCKDDSYDDGIKTVLAF